MNRLGEHRSATSFGRIVIALGNRAVQHMTESPTYRLESSMLRWRYRQRASHANWRPSRLLPRLCLRRLSGVVRQITSGVASVAGTITEQQWNYLTLALPTEPPATQYGKQRYISCVSQCVMPDYSLIDRTCRLRKS